jgi:hypothetical protein
MANPTTNYGFVLPMSSDLVTDLPADFEVALQGVDTRLKALQPGTTAGDLAYSSATANTNTRLAIGTAGQVLRVNSGATAPEWATPAGGGKVLQVVSTFYTTDTTIASTSFTDTGLSLSITPTLATSKILVLITQVYNHNRSNTASGFGARIIRAATTIVDYDQTGRSADHIELLGSVTSVQHFGLLNMTYLDNPATTSATTYKTQARLNSTGQSANSTFNSGGSSMILLEIGA